MWSISEVRVDPMDGSGVGVAVGIEVADGTGVGSSVGVEVAVAAVVSVAAGLVLVGSAGSVGAGVCGLHALNTMPSTTSRVNQGEPFTTVFAFILSIEITFNGEMAMVVACIEKMVMMIVERMIVREKTRLMYPGTPD
jgi:hypothetical protein